MVHLMEWRNTLYYVFSFPFEKYTKGGVAMDKKEIKVIVHGTVDVGSLNEQQQKALYVSLLTRILTLYKEQKENNEKED